MSVATIRKLVHEKWRLEKRIATEIKKTFPKKSRATFEKGRGLIHAEIIDHSDDRIKILNLNSDKEYWIEAYWLYRE